MLIDISNIGPDGIAVAGKVPLEEIRLEGDRRVLLIDPRVRLEIRPGRRGNELTGHLDAVLRLACVRCLETFELPFSEPVQLLLVREEPGDTEGGESSRPETDDDVEVFRFQGDTVDVATVVREQVDLFLPMKPLCGAECRGLCARCGANLNQGPCGCPEPAGDPRWSALEGWQGPPARS